MVKQIYKWKTITQKKKKYLNETNYMSFIINRWLVSGQRHFNIFKLNSIIYFMLFMHVKRVVQSHPTALFPSMNEQAQKQTIFFSPVLGL